MSQTGWYGPARVSRRGLSGNHRRLLSVFSAVSMGEITDGIAAGAEAFLREYERRTRSRDVGAVASLIAPDATYWFADGSHRGRDAIVGAIAETWQTIEDESYDIRDVEVVAQTDSLAVLRYTFHWSGRIDGRPASGHGRGTSIVARRGDGWQILHEHLSA